MILNVGAKGIIAARGPHSLFWLCIVCYWVQNNLQAQYKLGQWITSRICHFKLLDAKTAKASKNKPSKGAYSVLLKPMLDTDSLSQKLNLQFKNEPQQKCMQKSLIYRIFIMKKLHILKNIFDFCLYPSIFLFYNKNC